MTPYDLASYSPALDGVTDDGPAVDAWLSACIADGATAYSSRAGVALCATFVTVDTTSPVRIDAPGLTLRGPEMPVNFLSCGGNVDVRGLGLERWKACFERARAKPGTIERFRLRDCTIANVANVVAIERPIGHARIVDNDISGTTGGYAIRIGRNVAAEQDDWHSIRIEGNDFEGITGTSSTAAVLVYGRKVSIVGNTVERVSNTGSAEAWGFYTKARQLEISGNTIVDVQTASHPDVVGINIKGAGRDGTGVQGYAVRCIGNHIERIGIAGVRGGCIRAQTDDVLVQANHCEDGGLDGITADEHAGTLGLMITGNRVVFTVSPQGRTGIRVCTGGKGHLVTGNSVRGAAIGLRLSASGGADGAAYLVATNMLDANTAALLVNTPRAMAGVRLEGNTGAGLYGFRNDNGAGAITGLRLLDNDFSACPTPVSGVMPAGCSQR